MSGKSLIELETLEEEVHRHLSSGSSEIDVDFWENVRIRVPIYKVGEIDLIGRCHVTYGSFPQAITHIDGIWKAAARANGVELVDVAQLIATRISERGGAVAAAAAAMAGFKNTAGDRESGDNAIDGWEPPENLQLVPEEDDASIVLSPMGQSAHEPLMWKGQEILAEDVVSDHPSNDDHVDDEDGEDLWLEKPEEGEERMKSRNRGLSSESLAAGEDPAQPGTKAVSDRRKEISESAFRRRKPITPSCLAEEEEDANAVFERFVAREKASNCEDEMVLEGQEVDVSSGGAVPITSKYQLRKPRYFNRVRTGFEWNRYNQAHYDQDNPPPRVVQGYKFTIGYPNLLDPANNTPTWRLCPSESENDGTVILRFHGGPPYEDVAFRIVKREWDFNPRRGYRNCFDKGVLQLHFNFKRLRYRK